MNQDESTTTTSRPPDGPARVRSERIEWSSFGERTPTGDRTQDEVDMDRRGTLERNELRRDVESIACVVDADDEKPERENSTMKVLLSDFATARNRFRRSPCSRLAGQFRKNNHFASSLVAPRRASPRSIK